jgi:glycosyltransferase involved in cell wall biosynthesis
MLSQIAWRTPPRAYGPWEQVASLITEGLVRQGVNVTLFATADSKTAAKLVAACPQPLEENKELDSMVWLALHLSELFNQADKFDIIHSHLDIMPLTYARLINTPIVTTIHGMPSPQSYKVYELYDKEAHYVSISTSDRYPTLTYDATVHHGLDLEPFTFSNDPDDYLLFLGRIHHDKGVKEAVQVAQQSQRKLIIAGPIHDPAYFEKEVAPHVDGEHITYIGNVGPSERDKLLGKAAALLHLINFNEPFGLSVIEAMACGTAVLTSNVSSLPEVAGDAALVVDPADTHEIAEGLRTLLSDDDLRGTLARAGLSRAGSAQPHRLAGQIFA